MATYNHWHTAEVRTQWEQCLTRNSSGPYLCRKDVDFQSVFSHELTHVLGFGHAQQVSGGTSEANCTSPTVTRTGGNPAVRPGSCHRGVSVRVGAEGVKDLLCLRGERVVSEVFVAGDADSDLLDRP